jgi:predicted CoA-binding protein
VMCKEIWVQCGTCEDFCHEQRAEAKKYETVYDYCL